MRFQKHVWCRVPNKTSLRSSIEHGVLDSTVSTVILTAGRGKGRLEWGKQHLLTVGT